MNKTLTIKNDSFSKWYIVDAKDKTLGRLCTQIASTLRGKNNITYTPHQINNSYVVVINAQEIHVSGKKKSQKNYFRHSGRPGSLKKENFEQLQKRIPNRIIEKAVKGMLPKNKLGRELFRHLKVYNTSLHPHKAHNLEEL